MKREPFKRMTLSEIRRRPTLPGRFQPSTISVLRLNFCVRDGNRWIPQAIVTGNMGLSRSFGLLRFRLRSRVPFCFASLFLAPSKPHRFECSLPSDHDFRFHSLTFCLGLSAFPSGLPFPVSLPVFPSGLAYWPRLFQIILSDQALDRLVSPSSIHCCTSTDDLSTLSSSRGLTCF